MIAFASQPQPQPLAGLASAREAKSPIGQAGAGEVGATGFAAHLLAVQASHGGPRAQPGSAAAGSEYPEDAALPAPQGDGGKLLPQARTNLPEPGGTSDFGNDAELAAELANGLYTGPQDASPPPFGAPSLAVLAQGLVAGAPTTPEPVPGPVPEPASEPAPAPSGEPSGPAAHKASPPAFDTALPAGFAPVRDALHSEPDIRPIARAPGDYAPPSPVPGLTPAKPGARSGQGSGQETAAAVTAENADTAETLEALARPAGSPAALPQASAAAPGPSLAASVTPPALVAAPAPGSAIPASPAFTGAGAAPALSPSATLEQFVEQIADAREAGRSIRPEITLRHGEFGPVAMRIEASAGANMADWRATIVARDPGFLPAVQAALGERAALAAGETGQGGSSSPRGHDGGSGGSGAPMSGSGSGSGADPRYGSSTGAGQGSAKPYSGQEAGSGSNAAAADPGDIPAPGDAGAQGRALFA